MNKTEIAKTGLKVLTVVAPVPGLSLLLNKRVRRTARKFAGLALLGAGAAVAVPVALYVICKTSPDPRKTNG